MNQREQHELRFARWSEKLSTWLKAKRGRTSELARHLGVNRQSAHRWFAATHHPKHIPPWAVIAANIWYSQKKQDPLA